MRKTTKAFISSVAALTVTFSSVGIPAMVSVPVLPTNAITAYAADQVTSQYHTVNVTGGKINGGKTSGKAKVSQLITVTPDEPEEGQQFSYWVNVDTDLIVSYNEVYSFHMSEQDVNLEARYSTSASTKYGIATARTVTADKAAKKVSFNVSLNIPEGCTYVRGGVVATSSKNIRAGVNLSNAEYVKVSSKGTEKTKNLSYTWTKNGANEDTVWFVKGYLVYKDEKGVERTSYSKCMKGNINGDVSSENGAILNEETGVISLRGLVSKSDVEELKYNHSLNLKKVVAEEGSSITGDISYLFNNYKVEEVDLSKLDTTGITDMTQMFAYTYGIKKINMHGFDTSKVTSMHWMLYECHDLEELDITGWDTSKVEDMDYMFAYNKKLTEIDISGFDFSNVKTMLCMFYRCEGITSLDMSRSNMSKLEKACLLAAYCENLINAKFGNSTTSKLDDAGSLFYHCSSLKNVDVSTLNTSNVTNMNGMFQDCTSLESVDVSNFDTSKVTDMGSMFRNCTSLESLDVSGFNTSKVTDMSYMFSGCMNLQNIDIIGFDFSGITNYESYSNMFDDPQYLAANIVSAYKTELTNGYMAKIKVYITPGENAVKAVVGIGNQTEEIVRDNWNLDNGRGYILYTFKSNTISPSDTLRIKFYDAENRLLPVKGTSNTFCKNAEFTRSLSDVTRTYFRVTTVVGDESSYVEYNAGNKKLVLDKNFINSSLIPDGYKLSGWEINGTFYPMDSEYWTGGRDTTITAVLVEKAEREMISLSLDTPVTAHYEDGDSDTFSFTAEEAGTYIFTSEGAYQMTGRLYSNAGMTDIITNESNNNGAGNFRIRIDLEAGQTVYMNNLSSRIQDYTVTVTKSDFVPKTEALALDTASTGHYEDEAAFDIFTFTAPEDGVYIITCENSEGGISGFLYSDEDMNYNIASLSEYEGSIRIRAVLTEGQTVYLMPSGYYSNDSCDYTVSVAKKVVVAREPIAMTLNTVANGNYTDPDDFDRFSFTAQEAGTYRFIVENTSYTEMQAYLYSDAALTEQIAGGIGDFYDYYVKSTISVNLTAGQTVYLTAKAYYEDEAFSYTAIVKLSQATPLTLGSTQNGYYGTRNDCDYFLFTATEDGYYSFTGQSDYNIRPELYSNSDLTYFIKSGSYTWDDNGGRFSVCINLTAGQTVYLKPVSEYSEMHNVNYSVTAAKMNIGVSALVLNTPTSGRFEDSDVFSYFSFTAEEAGTYYFASDCDRDTLGYLYNDAALTEQIAYDDDSNGNYQFKIEYYLEAGQTVYLKPVEYGEDESCDYTVTVTDYDPSGSNR